MPNYRCDHCGYEFHDSWTASGLHRCPECHYLTEAVPLKEKVPT